MSATYSSSLASSVDWVRFLCRDTDVTNAMLQDEEIVAVVAAARDNGLTGGRSSAVYFAAADCLAALHTAWMSKGQGVASKKMQRVSLVFGTGSGINIDIAMQQKITELRKRGARLLSRPHFRMI